MSSFKCPFCNQLMSIDRSTKKSYSITFDDAYSNLGNKSIPQVKLTFYKCPNEECERHTLYVRGTADMQELDCCILPRFVYSNYPECVPEFIQQDYREACAIKDLSPKASATMARRCLQGMIRDFHGVKRNTLHQEIEALKNKIEGGLYDALMAMKSIGNVGAHPDVDVNLIVDIEQGEASKLIELIELLIDEWYIAREKRNALLLRLNEISDEKSNIVQTISKENS
ncbi:MAG: DUF4145 domain-containing protein [Oscillospiraceae bacterium]|nr:DUF4145 domain-containing protein [Oscillospiraceae bacterium]